MKLGEVADALNLIPVVDPNGAQREMTGGYASDLLSCAMARAGAGNVWVTLQRHPNIIAVASLLDFAGVIVAEADGQESIDEATIEKARAENVALYATPLTTYSVVAKLARAGVPGVDV